MVQCFAPDHGEAADDHVHGQGAVVGKVEHVFAGEEPRILEPCGEAESITKIVPERRESPAGALHGHVRIQHPRADVPHFRMLVEEIGEGAQAAREEDYIRIHQSDIAALALADGHIVAFSEAEILRALNESYPWVPGFDHFRGAVGRSIVHHEDFHAAARRRFGQAVQAQLQVVLSVPADDDN